MLKNQVKGDCTPFITLVLQFEPGTSKKTEYRYALDKDFFKVVWYDLALETLYKVNAHSLTKGTLLVKYVPDWAILKENKDKWSRKDRGTERLITIGCPLIRALIMWNRWFHGGSIFMIFVGSSLPQFTSLAITN